MKIPTNEFIERMAKLRKDNPLKEYLREDIDRTPEQVCKQMLETIRDNKDAPNKAADITLFCLELADSLDFSFPGNTFWFLALTTLARIAHSVSEEERKKTTVHERN